MIKFAVILFAIAAVPFSFAQVVCKVSFEQNGLDVPIQSAGLWNIVNLSRNPFSITVSPTECKPLVATLPNQNAISEVEWLTPLVFAGAGHAFAGLPENADILYNPTRLPIRAQLRDVTQQWQSIEAYDNEAKVLGYKPQPVQAWGTTFPFVESGLYSKATFRRLFAMYSLDSFAKPFKVHGVIYLATKRIGPKPWSGAEPPFTLYQPFRMLMLFE